MANLEIELKFKLDGREVRFDAFVAGLKLQLTEVVRNAIQQQRSAEPTGQLLRQQNAPASPRNYASDESTGSARSVLRLRPEATPRVVSIHDAAQILGLQTSTIRAWIGRRKIASVRRGRRVMIRTESIEEPLENGLAPARKPVLPDQSPRSLRFEK